MSHTDTELLNNWSEREDAEAFQELARRYGALVYGVCLRILRDPVEAEDAAQECFLALATTPSRPGDYAGPWLHRVAANLSLKRRRGDVRRRERETAYASTRPTSSAVEMDDLHAHIQEAINALPDDERVPIIAHFLEGNTHAAIAAHLDVSRPTVTLRVTRGVKRIRAMLRHRGVMATTAVLTTALAANAKAVPASLAKRLGNIALAGPKSIPVQSAAEALALAELVPTMVAPSFAIIPSMFALAVLLFLFFAGGVGWLHYREIDVSSTPPAVTPPLPPPSTPPAIGAVAAVPAPAPAEALASYAVLGKGRVTGVVLDAAGHPVGGVHVTLESAYSPAQDLPAAAHFKAQVTTFENGSFDFRGIPLWRASEAAGYMSNTTLSTRVKDKQGYATTRISSVFREAYVEVILQGPIRGDVLSGKILPAPGGSLKHLDVRVNLLRPWAKLENGPSEEVREIQPDGSFYFRGLLPGIYAIVADADDLWPQESTPIPTGTRNFTFQLQRGIDITVLAVDAATGAPLDDVNLRLEATGFLPLYSAYSSVPQSAEHAGNAKQFKNLHPWRYRVTEESAPWTPVAEDLYLAIAEDGPKEFTVRFAPATDFALGANTEQRVQYAPPPMEGAPPAPPITVTRSDTAATKAPSTPVHGHVMQCDGTTPDFGAATIVSCSAAEEDRPGFVAGPNAIAYSASDGSFFGEVRGTGPFYFQAIDDHCISQCFGPIAAADLASTSIDFVINVSDRISGTVVDSRGRPLSGVVVSAMPQADIGHSIVPTADGTSYYLMRDTDPKAVARMRTGESGKFIFPALYPGNYTLHAQFDTSNDISYTADLPANLVVGNDLNSLVIKIPLEDGNATLSGQATILGEPAPGLIITIDNHANQVTGPRGEYRFFNVAPGTHEISARNNLASRFDAYDLTREFTIESGEQQVLDLPLASGTCTVEGRILLNGSPMPGSQIRFWVEEEPEMHEDVEVWTDDNGHYRAEGLYALPYRYKIDAFGNEPWAYFPSSSELAHLNEGEVFHNDVVIESATVEILLTAAPDANATVGIFPDLHDPGFDKDSTRAMWLRGRTATKTNAPGRSRLSNVRTGDLEAFLFLPGADGAPTTVARLPFTLTAATSVELTVDATARTITLSKQSPDTYRAAP